jgi:hypothetical protein
MGALQFFATFGAFFFGTIFLAWSVREPSCRRVLSCSVTCCHAMCARTAANDTRCRPRVTAAAAVQVLV